MSRSARTLAVLVSAVLGVAGGIVAGVASGHDDYPDPLGLGVPMINQPCQPKAALLLLGSSDDSSGLGSELATFPDAKYLRTADSCNTAWRGPEKVTQAYTAYLGPMDRNTACELQLTGAHVGDRVTMLTAGETELVQCLCYVSNADAPELRSTNDSLSDDEIVYLRALQQLLTSMDRRPDTAPRTDVYTSQTIEEVKRFQQFAGHLPSGIVDSQTWKLLKGRGC